VVCMCVGVYATTLSLQRIDHLLFRQSEDKGGATSSGEAWDGSTITDCTLRFVVWIGASRFRSAPGQ
jgi:hypothetical protein